jgi:hypothetical protein
LLALLEQEGSTLADVLKLFADRSFRQRVVGSLVNKRVADFWRTEYEAYPLKMRIEAVAPIQNKVGAFLSNPILYRILTRPGRGLELRSIMDQGKILLVNLAKGRIGEDTAALLGALLVSSMGVAALSRTNVAESERRDFFLYLDEFQNYTTLSLAGMLSELRKYRLNLILAHQYLTQLDPLVRSAILGNVGTIISFRVGVEDAMILVREFEPVFRASDLVGLPNRHIYLKLMIDGEVSPPFSAETLGMR